MSDEQRWVSVASITDPVQLEMWQHLLEQEGIPAQTAGLRHAQAIGGPLTASMLGVELRVRAVDAERARDLLESLDLGVPVDRDEDQEDDDEPPRLGSDAGTGPYRRDPRAGGRRTQPKSTLVSTGVGLFLSFGAGHFYAGEVASGALLALAEVFAFALLMTGQTTEGAVFIASVIGLDVVGARGAVARANAGKRYSPMTQGLRTAGLLLLALAVAKGIGFALLGR